MPVLNLITGLGISYLMGLYVSITALCERMKTGARIQERRSISRKANFSQVMAIICSAVCMAPGLIQKMVAASKAHAVMNG